MKSNRSICAVWVVAAVLGPAELSFGQNQPLRLTLDSAIEIALHLNHNLIATRTTVQQSQAQEVTANLRPNPGLFGTWAYLPLSRPEDGWGPYLHDLTEVDTGLSYTIERGGKRRRRLLAAKDATTVTRSQVTDTERTLTFQVASLFIDAQLAESLLDVAQQNLKSFQGSVDIAESQFKAGAISENDYQKIRLQLLQFQTDVQQAQLTKVQALSDLRQQLGYESVPADYSVSGALDYQPMTLKLEDLQEAALLKRPDLQGARQGVAAARSQFELAGANAKQDVTVTTNYSHVNGGNHVTVSVGIPLPIFDRNQGEIARTLVAINQARQQEASLHGQVLTEVKDAYEALQTNDRVTQYFRSGYLDTARRNRDISEYSYRRGAASLLDFLDAERSYRSAQLAYRQSLASYLQALEQLRQAVGTRSLPQ